MRRVALPVSVLALTLVPISSAAPLPNPCALLTSVEVAKALGSKVANRTSQGSPQGSRLYGMCTWTGQPMGYFQAGATLRVLVAQSTKPAFVKGANATPGAIPVRGLGQAAFSTTRQLQVFQHGIALSFLPGYPVRTQVLMLLARAALPRL